MITSPTKRDSPLGGGRNIATAGEEAVNKLAATIVACLASGTAQAAGPVDAPWVLLGVSVFMGAVSPRDTTKDADTVSIAGEGLPVYPSQVACEVALRHAIQKYAGRSHAEGNFGRYACVNFQTWATSDR
jgi:hypothetical protein